MTSFLRQSGGGLLSRWRCITIGLNRAVLTAAVGMLIFSEAALGEVRGSAEPATQKDVAAGEVVSLDCSRRFHAALGGEILEKARSLQVVADSLWETLPAMPGYWLFWNGSGIAARSAYQKRLLSTQIVNLDENRLCKRSVLVRGGRIRCLKWVPLPEGYVPPEPKPSRVEAEVTEITQAERRIAASLGVFVRSKGAVRDLTQGTAFLHTIQRATDELIAYAGQPYRPAICSGAGAMLEFYRARLKPLRTKLATARALRQEAIAMSLAAAGKVLDGHQQAGAKDDREISHVIRNVLSTELLSGEMEQFDSVSEPMPLLAAARDILTDDRFGGLDKQRRQRLRKALRNIEFLVYADHKTRRLELLKASFHNIFQSVVAVHGKQCKCNH